MAMNTVTIIKLPDGREMSIMDWTDIPYYSSIDLASGFTDQVAYLFQLEAGRNVPYASQSVAGTITPRTATTNDTNIEVPGQLDSEEEMLIYAIKPEVSAYGFTPLDFTSRTELGATAPLGAPSPQFGMTSVLQAHLVLELEISEKVYAQAGFAYFNPGFGPFGTSVLNGGTLSATPVAMANNGFPSQEAVRSFAIPHHIGGQEKYRVNLRNSEGTPINLGLNTIIGGGGQTNTGTVMCTLRVYLDGLRKRNVG